MKKTAIIFMLLVMLATLLTAPVYADEPLSSAEDEGTVRFYNFKYEDYFLYIKHGGSYYVCSKPETYEDSNFYFEKTAVLGSGNAIWHLDLYALAQKKSREIIQVANYSPVLCGDKYLYLPVWMSNKDYAVDPNFLFCILKVDTATGKYELLESPEFYGIPWMIKKYNGKLYFGLQDSGLCYMDEKGDIFASGLEIYDISYSQTSSKSKYIYGMQGLSGLRYNLRIFNLDSQKRINTIKYIRGYSVTDSKLYYAKIADSRFKVYSASLTGKNAKVIFSRKPIKGHYLELSRVTSKYIYYKAQDTDFATLPVYYRYSRSTKKTKTIGYEEYAKNASDYREGFFAPVG